MGNLHASTLEAIWDYGLDGYLSLNAALREGRALSTSERVLHERLMCAVEPASEAATLWRGMALPHAEAAPSSFTDEAWVSTCPDREIAAGFGRRDQSLMRVLLQIHVPQGYPVIMLGEAIDLVRPGSGFAGEVTLAPGAMFAIERCTPDYWAVSLTPITASAASPSTSLLGAA